MMTQRQIEREWNDWFFSPDGIEDDPSDELYGDPRVWDEVFFDLLAAFAGLSRRGLGNVPVRDLSHRAHLRLVKGEK